MKKTAIALLLILAPAAHAAEVKTSCANVGSASARKAEKAEICLVNEERVRVGLGKLKTSSKLTKVARAHSRDMVRRRYFDHTDPDGDGPFDRMLKASYKFQAAGENIFIGPRSAAGLVSGWMASKGHCTDILGSQFTETGMGIAKGTNTLSTQLFGTPITAKRPKTDTGPQRGCPYKGRHYV